MIRSIALLVGITASCALKIPSRGAVDANAVDAIFKDMFRCSCDDCDSCSKFNQDLSRWSVGQATDMSNMF